MLPALLEKMEGAVNSNTNVGGVDVDVLKGVLGTLESVFKRFRGQYIDTIAKDLEYVQQVIAPLLRVAGVLTAQVVASGGQVVAVEDATLLLSVFYSLNSPGLTAEFEDHLAAWMDCIHKLLVLPTAKATDVVVDDDEAPVDACKAMACECLSLFMERNEEEFAGFLETFVESVWKQLVEVGPGGGAGQAGHGGHLVSDDRGEERALWAVQRGGDPEAGMSGRGDSEYSVAGWGRGAV